MNKNEIMVSIVCVTYNHKNFIVKAIEGFLSQDTTFDYEIIIHDDASNDGTLEILQEYENKHIQNLHIYYEKENQYQYGKTRGIINRIVEERAQGKYIAVCEGDDCWIDNKKLQIQVDFMENHPEYIMTAHNGLWVDNKTFQISTGDGIDRERDLTFEDIIRHKRACFPTASIVIKKEYYVLKEPFANRRVWDWPLQLSCIDKGKIYYFDRIMSIYNVNVPGAWTTRIKADKNGEVLLGLDMMSLLHEMDERWNYRYTSEIQNALESYCSNIINILTNAEQDAREYIRKINGETNGKYDEICCTIEERLDEVEQQKVLLQEYVDGHPHNLIMGCGKIAGEVFEKMQAMGMDVDGFVISNNQKAPMNYKEKKVWKFSEMPYDKEHVGIIVGIQRAIKSEIMQSLKDNDIDDYFWPLI